MNQVNSTLSKYPPVSVAIATYNGAKYLEEQLDSILAQTVTPSEIIVCDDGSDDGTIQILEKYQRNGLLKYYRNEKRLGYIGNFKKAVSLTSGSNYVSLSDQDDFWYPEKIEAAMKLMLTIEDNIKPAMVYSDLILVDVNKNLLNKSFRNELGQDTYKHCLNTLLFGGFVNGCTMLINPEMRAYFNSIPENNIVNHDTWISLIAYTFGNVAIVPETLIEYRKHTNNATELEEFKKKNRFQRVKNEIFNALKSNDLFEKELIAVSEFYTIFKSKIDHDHQQLIEKFIKLRGKSYIAKKIALRIFFRQHWL